MRLLSDNPLFSNRSSGSTIAHIKRNSYHDDEQPQLSGYYSVVADREAAERRARNRKLVRMPNLLAAVLERLKTGWTPEQIAGRLIQIKSAVRVCHETIYAYIYSKEGLASKLWRYLHKHRARRRTRTGRKPQLKRFTPEVCNKCALMLLERENSLGIGLSGIASHSPVA